MKLLEVPINQPDNVGYHHGQENSTAQRIPVLPNWARFFNGKTMDTDHRLKRLTDKNVWILSGPRVNQLRKIITCETNSWKLYTMGTAGVPSCDVVRMGFSLPGNAHCEHEGPASTDWDGKDRRQTPDDSWSHQSLYLHGRCLTQCAGPRGAAQEWCEPARCPRAIPPKQVVREALVHRHQGTQSESTGLCDSFILCICICF